MNALGLFLFEKLRLILLSLIFLSSCTLQAQDKVTQEFKATTIASLNEMLIENYVFKDVAQKTADHLTALLKKGAFDADNDLTSFAASLTKEVQSINKDKHMRIRKAPVFSAPSTDPMHIVEETISRQNNRRGHNFGFESVKRLEGNVGYIDLRGFAGVNGGAPLADAAMALLNRTDAIIIDIRRNGGGSPEMVQYLCSYFFKERTHLNSLYWRRGDETVEYWTHDEINGEKLSDVPLFVVTSSRTFSAAEEFSYNMQTRKRATLVGETTGGGANPGGVFPINEDLTVFIPTGRAINPVTKTNWEGVGVVPEVKVAKEDALDKAIELATAAAKTYKEERMATQEKLLSGLIKAATQYKQGKNNEAVMKNVKACVKAGILSEGSINNMGYDFLHNLNKPNAAIALFEANTVLFSNSANVYDSYAEALMAVGNKTLAIKNLEKAVKLGAENNDPNLDLYKENLRNAQR